MSKSKVVCAVGSAGLSVVAMLLVVAVGAAGSYVLFYYGLTVPDWSFWTCIVALLVLVPVGACVYYRIFFEECYEPGQGLTGGRFRAMKIKKVT